MTPGKKGRLGALPRELGKDIKALRGDRQIAGGRSWNRSNRIFLKKTMDNMLQFLIMKPEQLILIYHALLMRSFSGFWPSWNLNKVSINWLCIPPEHSGTEKPFSQWQIPPIHS